MFLLKAATGMKMRSSDCKSSALSNPSQLHFGPLFFYAIFAVQIFYSPPLLFFHLSPIAPFFETFESNYLSHSKYVAGQGHWIAKHSPGWLIFLVTSEILLWAGSLPRLMPHSLMDTLCEGLVKKRKWGGWPGRHCAPCLTRKRFLRFLPWTFLFMQKEMEMKTKDSGVCDWDSWASKLQICLFREFSFVPPSLDAESHQKECRFGVRLLSFKSSLHCELAV